MLVCVLFLFLLVSGVGCILWLWHSLDFSFNFFYVIDYRRQRGICLLLHENLFSIKEIINDFLTRSVQNMPDQSRDYPHWWGYPKVKKVHLCTVIFMYVHSVLHTTYKDRVIVQIEATIIWAASSEFGTYRLCEQRRFRWACAFAQSRQNLRCSLIQAVSREEPSDRKPDPWLLWMAGHVQLKFVMTECSKTQIHLTGLIFS